MDEMRMQLAIAAVTILAFLGLPAPHAAMAQDEEDELFRPGLLARYEDAQGSTVERVDRNVRIPAGSRHVDRRLASAPRRVQWSGYLMSQGTGKYQLHVHGAGQIQIRLGENTVLETRSEQPQWSSTQPIELAFDYHPLAVDYESPGSGGIALFWSGPQFGLEPVEARQLFHDRDKSPADSWARGEDLVRALRCAACHEIPGEPPPLAAPALTHVAGSTNPAWLVSWLSSDTAVNPSSDTTRLERRMPHFPLDRDEAEAIAAYLLARSQPIAPPPPNSAARNREAEKDKGKSKAKKKGDDEPPSPPKTPAEKGKDLVFTLGCLACHRVGEVGGDDLFGGGDLSLIADKRPAPFFATWLAAPQHVNPQHRMPLFELSEEERQHLTSYLQTLKSPNSSGREWKPRIELATRGEQLFRERRCDACHDGARREEAEEPPPRSKLTAETKWERSCTNRSTDRLQPHYRLSDDDEQAIRAWISNAQPQLEAAVAGERLLREQGCVSCHARDEFPGLAAHLTKLAAVAPELAPLVPAMTPPPLISVGDKLHDRALRDAIRREGPPHRPYLLARMPRFRLDDRQLDTLVHHLVQMDRIPPDAPAHPSKTANSDLATGSENRASHERLLEAVGSRLVTPDGFGCTSCHQVGKVMPVKAPLNARGPDLSMLSERIRREWFDRWVRNPARMVPRMEMPSVQVAVRGVLEDDLDRQLAAVWSVLNLPDFQPPEPNPVRIVRQTGTSADARAHVITDVVRAKPGTYVKPLLIGLANRHSVLFDLATARLAIWTVGDVARQRTEGKTWYWELAGTEILTSATAAGEFSLWVNGRQQDFAPVGPFATEFDLIEHEQNGVRFTYRLQMPVEAREKKQSIFVSQTFLPLPVTGDSASSGFRRVVDVSGVEPGMELRWQLAEDSQTPAGSRSPDGKSWLRKGRGGENAIVRLLSHADQRLDETGTVIVPVKDAAQPVRMELEYATDFLVDRFPFEPPVLPPIEPQKLYVVPGFTADRLPLSEEIMTTALAWRPDGTMVIASLKGQVWQATDRDRDGLADELRPFSDDLAAPYGVHATADYVDVVNKYGLLRLFDDDRDGRADRMVTVASGWGHTTDYHDWAVGLPSDETGAYYVALPCQQDQRSPAAAHLRGEFLKLVPRTATPDDPRLYGFERISRGHRFPMGIARNRDGELFVTDNQGNYNPFNELNHVQPGAHFGFINAVEKGEPPPKAVTPPAINIPHPWTRSVNGICFLDTPRQDGDRKPAAFGPWEGHLIGCEYDTRRLVRMTLERVGDSFQGAIYPFSFDQPASGPPFLGPITCAVSPDGDLYVGGLRDSGWGGANNIGEVVRLRLDSGQLPNGIREMRLAPNGFTVEFVERVDATRAGDVKNYSLVSYTRESTPAYGGPDVNRRTESIRNVRVARNQRQVLVELGELREGYVYELHVKNLDPERPAFFPAEAHYTLRRRAGS